MLWLERNFGGSSEVSLWNWLFNAESREKLASNVGWLETQLAEWIAKAGNLHTPMGDLLWNMDAAFSGIISTLTH